MDWPFTTDISCVLYYVHVQRADEAHKELNMTIQETQLIEAIKRKPGYQVFNGRNGNSSIIIYYTYTNGVRSQSVWLGRSGSVARLQSILEA
jgi:hypothetical protein